MMFLLQGHGYVLLLQEILLLFYVALRSEWCMVVVSCWDPSNVQGVFLSVLSFFRWSLFHWCKRGSVYGYQFQRSTSDGWFSTGCHQCQRENLFELMLYLKYIDGEIDVPSVGCSLAGLHWCQPEHVLEDDHVVVWLAYDVCVCVFGFYPDGCVIGSFIVLRGFIWFYEFMVDGYITMVHVFLTLEFPWYSIMWVVQVDAWYWHCSYWNYHGFHLWYWHGDYHGTWAHGIGITMVLACGIDLAYTMVWVSLVSSSP